MLYVRRKTSFHFEHVWVFQALHIYNCPAPFCVWTQEMRSCRGTQKWCELAPGKFHFYANWLPTPTSSIFCFKSWEKWRKPLIFAEVYNIPPAEKTGQEKSRQFGKRRESGLELETHCLRAWLRPVLLEFSKRNTLLVLFLLEPALC